MGKKKDFDIFAKMKLFDEIFWFTEISKDSLCRYTTSCARMHSWFENFELSIEFQKVSIISIKFQEKSPQSSERLISLNY
jgi:hypothetical protein